MKKTIIFLAGIFIFTSCVTKPKNDKNNLGDFPPQPLGRLMAAVVKRGANELLPREYSLVLIPNNNKVRIHHKFMGDNIWLFFTQEDRDKLIQAINQYLKEYKSSELNPKAPKSYFGETSGEMIWGVLNAAYSAKPKIRFEYQFIKPKRPYFIVANSTVQSKEGNNCPAMRAAFSPAQCKDLMQMLRQETIMNVVGKLKESYERYDISDSEDFDDEQQPVTEDNTPLDADSNFDE